MVWSREINIIEELMLQVMIGGLYSQGDIGVFLEAGDLVELENGVLEGPIIKVNKPEQQGRVTLLVDDKRVRGLLAPGIGVILNWNRTNNGNEVYVFMNQGNYEYLRKNGRTGTRYNGFGSQVSVREEKVDESSVELLRSSYDDYRGKIPRQTKLF